MESSSPQVSVLDAGGQYCHLIARKVRELGVYAEVRASETPAAELADRKALIISGGPASVYEEASPKVDPAVFSCGPAVLGICYGFQLMVFNLGGEVERGERGEYGMATLAVMDPGELLVSGEQQVWMSHRDTVSAIPAGFRLMARTDTCAFAAVGDAARRLYGVQFHPEVVHTRHGAGILKNFLFEVAGCTKDWDPKNRVPLIEQQIRETVGNRKVFFFVSGGVDSTVAYTLCLRSLGPDRVRGVYVDSGLMREGETDFVRDVFQSMGASGFSVESQEPIFLAALQGVCDPEQKRHIIGEKFVEVQERILAGLHGEDWILGQGTIYPDTIESGGSAKADVIKTHHNRVAGIQRLIAGGRIVEPLTSFYKDEVREIGAELGLPAELLGRHPFPGPGLAIRCICSTAEGYVENTPDGWLIPIHTVGVQGDSRTYNPMIAIEGRPIPGSGLHHQATVLINRLTGINRVVASIASICPLETLRVFAASLTPDRLARLRRADAIVRRMAEESGFDREVWQFPVVLIPVGQGKRRDAVVLRPIHSVDGMTAQSVPMTEALLSRISGELMKVHGVSAVFYDLTNKPPATIEWE
ncbi:MAG: glutamine-hydrolyzing GMP synthase [Bryobacterales bacterium]|nr:glutamine-hydrolyzing GMP synthase [Bryobacterales bacterium]